LKTDSRSASQDMFCPLLNPKVHYRVHKARILFHGAEPFMRS